jgi:serine/threonine protein kinase
VDARSDLFSLGTVLYEALTGARAFGKGTFSEILMRLAYEHPSPPSQLVKDIPPAVDDIVAHALAKNPAERYGSADALVEDIEDALFERPLRHAARKPATSSLPAVKASTASLPALTAPSGERAADLPRGPLVLPKDKRVSLSMLSGPQAGTEHLLRHASLLIGREGGNAGAGIELAETQVSRMHAMIEARGMRFVLRDLESKNGTFIGTERVQEKEIEHGTEFQIGGTRFMLLVADL